MFFGFDLKEIFYFPIKDAEARKFFLIAALVSLSAFVIPILPYFLLIGYAIQIIKQIFNNESPRMVAWDDWGDLFKDGAKIFGVRFIYSLPIIILIMPMMIASFALPFITSSSSNPESSPFFGIFTVIFGLTMCIMIPVSIVVAVIVPAAEMHAIDNNDFTAAFRFREWWDIFRANLSGFIAAFGIYYIATIALTIVVQILMATLILACLVPFLMPAIIAYSILIMYVTIAIAYRDGKVKLAQSKVVEVSA
jgi:hypothetical protein